MRLNSQMLGDAVINPEDWRAAQRGLARWREWAFERRCKRLGIKITKEVKAARGRVEVEVLCKVCGGKTTLEAKQAEINDYLGTCVECRKQLRVIGHLNANKRRAKCQQH